MRTGNKSKILSIEVGNDYKDKFTKIHNHYNSIDNDQYIYLPKYKVLQQMIDAELERLKI
jgi:hypothetical protein